MRVVFLGTPEFAVPALQALVAGGHNVVGVFTQPDRPKGRGNRIEEPPVKRTAIALNLAVHQPERIRGPEAVELLRRLAADVMVVVGYGQIIPQSIIDLPRFGILNVHASLLPKYRGAAPIQWAIANGEGRTGVTIMKIDAGLDTGAMLLKWVTEIGPDETAPQLASRLAPRGAELLIDAVERLEAGGLAAERQNDAEATYAPILKKEDGRVEWMRPASEIFNRLRGFTPWPGAYTTLRGQQLQICHAKVHTESAAAEPGTVRIQQRRLFAVCHEGSMLELLEVQLQGKKRLAAGDFLNGRAIADNERLGETN